MARSDREPRLRIIIGPSAFPDRALTIWTRMEESRRPKRHRRFTGDFEEQILLPLEARQIIIADSHDHSRPQPLEGEIFTLHHGQNGWMINEAPIKEGLRFMPARLASRELAFDIVRTRTVEA